ncbi:hypothetical protein [Kribbella sp. HUAS MG21]|jgi:hypothetical protein|uniref:Uncharacterized protein n=1 Tax=Kribbella sp. HUAS MG21 TaxID=3160966 RepID=A0AAU7T689_9ACTN
MGQARDSSHEQSHAAGPRLALYEIFWRVICGLLVTVAVAAAAVLLPGAILGVVGVGVVLTGATAAAAYGADENSPPTNSRAGTVGNAMAGAAVVGLALGLSTVLSPAVLALAILLAVISPRAIRWYCVKLGARSPAGRPEEADRAIGELCREWHESYEALQQATTPTARLRIVMARQRCLDELERRDPEGLQAWLSSTASAAGDPRRFLGNP